MNRLDTMLFADGGWFRFPKRFLAILDATEALVLAYLCNQANVAMDHDRYENGWFFCSAKKMEKDIFFNRFAQIRLVNKLAAKGYVKTKRQGQPPKRWIKINYKFLKAQLIKTYELV